MGLCFEDFAVGHETASRTRTITEADIVNFAGLSGDFVELHMSETFAASGPFGKRIAHGLLVLSVSSGLMVQMGQTADTVIAFYGIDRLRFTKPTFIGDTVHVEKEVIATDRKGPGRGVITFNTQVLNQHGEPVVVFQDKLMVKARE